MKLHIQTRFAQIPNELVCNPNISMKAKGLYGLIQSKPDGWEFAAERIAKEAKEGVGSIKAMLRELEEFGYLLRVRGKDEKGYWDWQYILYCTPTFQEENPEVENRPIGNQPTPNRPNNKEGVIKKDLTRKKDIYIQEFLEKYPRARLVSKTKVAEKLRRETEENLSLIILALSDFLKYWEQEKTEIQYIPMATTWLNQKRWEIPPEIKQKQPNSSDIYTNPIN